MLFYEYDVEHSLYVLNARHSDEKKVTITPKYFEVIVSTYFYEDLLSFVFFEEKKSEEHLSTFATRLRTYHTDCSRTSTLAPSALSLSREVSERRGRATITADWLSGFVYKLKRGFPFAQFHLH